MDADVHVLFLLREQLFFSFSSLLPLWFVLFFLLFVLNNDGVSKRMETGKWILGKRVVSGRGLSRGGMDEGSLGPASVLSLLYLSFIMFYRRV